MGHVASMEGKGNTYNTGFLWEDLKERDHL
jgi:hypothetical protein